MSAESASTTIVVAGIRSSLVGAHIGAVIGNVDIIQPMPIAARLSVRIRVDTAFVAELEADRQYRCPAMLAIIPASRM
ncbi:MAG: hypothetical protein ACLVEF_07865 [Bifidobacterium bifidum]